MPGQPIIPDTPKPSSKGKVGLLIAAVVVLFVVLGAGVAGFLIWNKSRSNTVATTGPTSNTNVAPAAPREIASYWLELEPPSAGAKAPRVAALVPLASGQSFRFHFVFSESGYVYIFGPGEKNQPTAFLTTKPWPDSGVKNNRVTQGGDFSFPSGTGYTTLDNKPGTDVFTVIFSRNALQSPAFLNDPVTLKPLSAAEQAELKAFVAKYQGPPVTENDESTPDAPSVRIKVPPDQTGNPIVFDIRIQHN